MAPRLTRQDFQKLAEMRVRAAKALLTATEWPDAFYIGGYAIECGLKACVAKLSIADEFPDRDRAIKAWTHSLTTLVSAADLNIALEKQLRDDIEFAVRWNWVAGPTGWSEQRRYRTTTTEAEALDLYDALTNPAHGIMRWIKANW